MMILGINDTHDSSVCLVKNGKLIEAVLEERITRKKNISSLPVKSIRYLINKYNLNYKNIDAVAVANNKVHHMNLWNVHSDFSIYDWQKLENEYYYPMIFKKKKIKLKKIFKNYKPKVKLGYPIKNIPFISSDEATKKDYDLIQNIRINTISKILKVDKKIIHFYDHHTCHAFYGYYSNPNRMKKVVVVTADGGGDGIYNTVNLFIKGKYIPINRSNKNWIGKIYESVTQILGLNPFRHCYKVMGLAPYSNTEKHRDVLKFFLNCLKVKALDFKVNPKIKDRYFYFKENLEKYRFDNIAGALQEFTEIRIVEWFNNIYKKFKIGNFIFSGGVANNVKANKILLDQNFVKSLWVPPGPGDESLCIGSAYYHYYKIFGYHKAFESIKPLTNAYLGQDFTKKSIKEFKSNSIIKKNFLNKKDKNFKISAKLLADGEIILCCQGKQEFGQRALGHRSILANPSSFKIVKKINETVKLRDFWMPFTPSILKKESSKYFLNPKKNNAQYMTICFDTTKIGKKKFAAAVHPYDETIRPQLVDKNTCKYYYNLITEFEKITKIGGLLNTSLNMHEFPIINNPKDIINEILSITLKKINFHILVNDDLFILKRK